MVKRPYHHGDVRQAALAEVLKLLDNGEADALSLRLVAQRIGVSHNALYRHFDSLADLRGEAASRCLTELNESLRRAIGQGANLEHRMRYGCTAYLQYALDYPARYELVFAPSTPMTSHQTAEKTGEACFGILVDLAVEAGAAEPELLAFHAWSTMHGTVELLKHVALPAGLGDRRAALASQAVTECTQAFVRVASS